MTDKQNFFDNTGDTTPFDNLEGQGSGNSAEGVDNQNDAPTGEDNQSQDTQVPQEPGGQASQTKDNDNIDYKTEYEKLKKSYDNLRPKFTQVTQELSKLRRQHQNSQQPQHNQQNPQQPQHNQQNSQQQVPNPQPQQRFAPNPIVNAVKQIVQPMQEQIAQMELKNEVARMATTKEDFNEVSPKMYEVLEQNPDFWNLGTQKALEIAYSVARTQMLESQMTQAVDEARQQAYQNRQVKEITGDEKTRVNTQSNNQKSPEQQIIDDILSVGSKGDIYF